MMRAIAVGAVMIRLEEAAEKVATAAEAGEIEPVDLGGGKLPADQLRAILLGLPVERTTKEASAPVALSGIGVRIKNATIVGELNLADGCELGGGAIRALALRDCQIREPIRISRGHIAHLSLRGSRICHLEATGLRIGGSLDLTGVTTSEPADELSGADGAGLCWIELQEAQIEGRVIAGNAVLAAPRRRPDFQFGRDRPEYGLNMRNVRVAADLELEPNFSAAGGVNLSGGEIRGDVWARGAMLLGDESFSLNAQACTFSSSVILRSWNNDGALKPLTANHEIWLMNAKIGRILDVQGADLKGGLVASGAEIGGNVLMDVSEGKDEIRRFTAADKVNFHGAKISGTLSLEGADLKAGLVAPSVEIGGNLLLTVWGGNRQTHRFTAAGDIDLLGAKIGGTLAITGADLGAELRANDVTIGRGADLGAWSGHDGVKILNVVGNVSLARSRITGYLSVEGAALQGDIDLYGIHVNGDAVFGGNHGLCCKGFLNIWAAEITGDVEIKSHEIGRGVYARGTVFGRDLIIEGAAPGPEMTSEASVPKRLILGGPILRGAIDISGARISGDVRLSDIGMSWFGVGLNAAGLKAEGRFDIRRIFNGDTKDPPKVRYDFSGAQVGRLTDDHETAWPAAGKLVLDGFTYDGIELHDGLADPASQAPGGGRLAGTVSALRVAVSHPKETWIALRRWILGLSPGEVAAVRRRWLELQYVSPPTPDQFKPQPYEQLARTLRAMGHSEAADEIAIAKRDQSTRCKSERKWSRFISHFMRTVAGHGYRPIRALAWTSAYAAVGAVAITAALAAGWIEFKPVGLPPESTVYEFPWVRVDNTHRLRFSAPIRPPELGCPSANAPLYALDIIIPVVELGQHEACHLEAYGVRGGIVQAMRAVYVLFGSILVAILFSTFAGILRHD